METSQLLFILCWWVLNTGLSFHYADSASIGIATSRPQESVSTCSDGSLACTLKLNLTYVIDSLPKPLKVRQEVANGIGKKDGVTKAKPEVPEKSKTTNVKPGATTKTTEILKGFQKRQGITNLKRQVANGVSTVSKTGKEGLTSPETVLAWVEKPGESDAENVTMAEYNELLPVVFYIAGSCACLFLVALVINDWHIFSQNFGAILHAIVTDADLNEPYIKD